MKQRTVQGFWSADLRGALKLSIALVALVLVFAFCPNAYAADQYSENIVPAMTSDTAPAPFVVTSSQPPYTYSNFTNSAWKIFDHSKIGTNENGSDYWYTQYGGASVCVDISIPKKVEKITLTSFEISPLQGSVKNWMFYGSNDNNTFTLITQGVQENTPSTANNVGTYPTWTQSYEFVNNNSYRYYKFEALDSYYPQKYVGLVELEMFEKLQAASAAPTNIVTTAGDKAVAVSWDAAEGATGYNVKWGTEPGNYTGSQTVTGATNCNITGLANGTTYYFVVSALNGTTESANSTEVSATPVSPDVSLSVEAVSKAKTGDQIIVDIVIHNANTICAEDIKISYDTDLLEYVGTASADGMKVYKESDISAGIKRYITACLGKTNAANGDKVLLKLVFNAKKAGEAKIDIIKGRIADNETLEMDVALANCGEKTILIEGSKDVNRSGEFTLLDLGIDAYYYGDNETATDTTKYDADIADNGVIDDDDLSEIATQIIKNPNYPGNN